MKQEIAQEWVNRLRSGKYPQTTGVLRRLKPDGGLPAGFCCLGVLCEMAVDAGIVKRKTSGSEARYESDCDSGLACLPSAVIEWAGLREFNINGGYGGFGVYSNTYGEYEGYLTQLNDKDELPFDEIADVIDENWETM